MVRARNDGEQGKRCGVTQQSGPESFAWAFLNILFLGECTAVSTGDTVFKGRAAGIRKQVTLSTLDAPVKGPPWKKLLQDGTALTDRLL